MRKVVMGMMTTLNGRPPVNGDEDIVAFVDALKAQEGGDIHLPGGARLGQTLVRLGLVDRYHFVVHPVVSAGRAWFDEIEEKRELRLQSAAAYSTASSASTTSRGTTDYRASWLAMAAMRFMPPSTTSVSPVM